MSAADRLRTATARLVDVFGESVVVNGSPVQGAFTDLGVGESSALNSAVLGNAIRLAMLECRPEAVQGIDVAKGAVVAQGTTWKIVPPAAVIDGVVVIHLEAKP